MFTWDFWGGVGGTAIVLGSLYVLSVYVAWELERRSWNGGNCPRCGCPWKLIGFDSQGGRGYSCYNHDEYVCGPWISYPWIDGF
jgi:hypothetical protein